MTQMPQNSKTFICGGDANYFPLMCEWLHSIRVHPQSKDFDINILDAGLTQKQRDYLKPLVTNIIEPDWPCDIPASRIRGRTYLKACVCRPFINKIFPGYDLYFWMDSDVWAQTWEGIDLFIKGAEKGRMALTSQADRAYPKGMRVKWLGRWPWKARSFYFSNARKAFGFKTAKKLFPYHVVLAGGFSLKADAPHWDKWQELVIKALKKGKVFTAEQLTLGIMIHLEHYPVEILPAWTHWLCEFKAKWDTKNNQWVEPYLPHKPLSLLHMSGFDEMRIDRSQTAEFETIDGKTIQKSYRFPDFNGEKA